MNSVKIVLFLWLNFYLISKDNHDLSNKITKLDEITKGFARQFAYLNITDHKLEKLVSDKFPDGQVILSINVVSKHALSI